MTQFRANHVHQAVMVRVIGPSNCLHLAQNGFSLTTAEVVGDRHIHSKFAEQPFKADDFVRVS